MLFLNGGVCQADLGDGADTLLMIREGHKNPNASEITLGAGADKVHFGTGDWLASGDQQPLSRAPWILDFNVDVDIISQIDITNLDAGPSLSADYIRAIDILGGSALIYDDPVNDSVDFCFSRFADVSADALQETIDLHTIFL